MPTITPTEQKPYLTNTSTYVNILYSENYSYVDLINLGIGAAGDIILEQQTDENGILFTHGKKFHFFDPEYQTNVLEPSFDERYVKYLNDNKDVEIPGSFKTDSLITETWKVPGVNNENIIIMEIRGSNSDGLYHMDIASDTVLTGMNDVVIGQQSVKNGIQYCMEQLNYMLRADVYYQGYYTHDTQITQNVADISTLKALVERNFSEDEIRFNIHTADVSTLIADLDSIHTQLDNHQNTLDTEIPDLKTKVSSLTSTVAEAYVQFMQFKTQTTANLNTVNSSVNTNTGKITDLSTYVNNHVSSLTNITNTHDASIRAIITKQAAHDSSIIDHDARLKANQSSITWLVDSEEQQDNLIATLQNEVKALTEVVTGGAYTEFITEMISNAKTECKNYTDTQLEPFMQLKSLGIMTGEDKTKIIDSLNGKVDSSSYAADVSVLTYSIYDIKNRYDKKFTELDYKIQNGGNDVVNANIAELERRISELENKFNVYQTLSN